MTKIVGDKWLDERAKYIERKTLKAYKKSLCWTSILQMLNKCVVMICMDNGCMEIDYDKYKEITKNINAELKEMYGKTN